MIAPDGTEFFMWPDDPLDVVNVNERVIVSAGMVTELGSGTWAVRVLSSTLDGDKQAYSLVVTGAISPASGDAAVAQMASSVDDDDLATGAALANVGSSLFLMVAVSSLTILASAMIA